VLRVGLVPLCAVLGTLDILNRVAGTASASAAGRRTSMAGQDADIKNVSDIDPPCHADPGTLAWSCLPRSWLSLAELRVRLVHLCAVLGTFQKLTGWLVQLLAL